MDILIKQARLGRIDLSDCVVYASGHPCPMCLSSMALSGIKEYVYANSVEDAYDVGLTISKHVYEYIQGDKDAIEMTVHHEAIRDDQKNPMFAWKKKQELNQ